MSQVFVPIPHSNHLVVAHVPDVGFNTCNGMNVPQVVVPILSADTKPQLHMIRIWLSM